MDVMEQGYISPRLLAELEAHQATLGTKAVDRFVANYVDRTEEPAPKPKAAKPKSFRLRWEERSGSFWGYSGKLVVAMVFQRSGDEPRWRWEMQVRTKRICQGDGDVRCAAAARGACDTAWTKWLAHAGLAPSNNKEI